MKVSSHYAKEGDEIRLVLTGMIVSGQVAAAVAQKWTKFGLFADKYANLIGGWCVQHFNDFKKPPAQAVSTYFGKWSNEQDRPRDEVRAVEDFLAGLSDEFVRRAKKTVQPDHVLKVAEDLFTKVRLRELNRKIQEYTDAGQLAKAAELTRKFDRVEMSEEEMVDLFADESVIDRAWDEKDEVLIQYPGAAGEFFGPRLKRKAFVSFEAPEKRGKSFALLDIACRGVQQGRKVAWFEAGDLSREDIVMRMVARVMGRSIDTEPYQYPVSMEQATATTKCRVILDDRREKEAVSKREAKRAFRKILNRYGPNQIRLSCHPAGTLSAAGIMSRLNRLRDSTGWVPDIVVVDYADILAPMNGTADTRDQINQTWMMLRALSMSYSCLVVTATQTNRASYDSEIIDMDHASEDKRKRAHVTGSIGINQNNDEQVLGLFRWNWIVARLGKFSRKKCLYSASCLATANPFVLTTWGIDA